MNGPRFVTLPRAAFAIFNLTLAFWHLPPMYNSAMYYHEVHIAQHPMFLVTAVLAWWPEHGRGQVLQLNYLLDNGAVIVNADGTFAVVDGKIREAVTNLTRDIMTIQATGDYAAAQELLKTMVVVRPPVQAVLDKFKSVPVDIEPRFTAIK